MANCIFCNVISGKVPSHAVWEDAHSMAFLDIYGSTDGHTLVLLKKHGETILDYSPDELKFLWATVQKVAAALQTTFATTVLSIGINHGEPKGVHHLHVHVMPRYEGDGGGIMQSLPGRKLRNKDFRQVAESIKKHIQ